MLCSVDMASAPSTTPIRSSLAHVLLQLKDNKNADSNKDAAANKLSAIHETEVTSLNSCTMMLILMKSRDSNSVDEAGMCNCRKSRCLKLYI